MEIILSDEYLSGLAPLRWADDAVEFHHIYQAGGAGVANAKAPLYHGDGSLLCIEHQTNGASMTPCQQANMNDSPLSTSS